MRFWAEVFTPGNTRIGTALSLTSASVTQSLDGAGTISLAFPATDEAAFGLLQLENRVRIYVEEDDQSRLLGAGVLRDLDIDDSNSGAKATVKGPDSLDALTRKSVLLGRVYDNQPISAIAADLTALVPGWSIAVDSSDLSDARFEGSNVLKSLIRLANEKGLHLREGVTAQTLELGAFGESGDVYAVKPNTITNELIGRDELVLIQNIKFKSSSRDIVNWAIPVGAGQGTAALTLKNSTANLASPQYVLAQDGVTRLYYRSNSESIDQYEQIERVISFPEIGPITNTEAAKTRAADALQTAIDAWLNWHSQPLATYNLSIKKDRTSIRPGDKIHVKYKGVIEVENSRAHTYLNVDDEFWVMKVTRTVNNNGISIQFEIATIDRIEENLSSKIVTAIESVEVKNLAVQTYPISWATAYYDTLGNTGGLQKNAEFVLPISNDITYLTRAKIKFKTTPLWTPIVYYDLTPDQMTWHMRQGYNHPSDVTLEINGEDVSDQFGGPWAVGVNTPIEVEADITNLILEAAGGLYQNHTIVLKCGIRTGEVRVTTSHPSVVNNEASSGIVEMTINVLAVAQGIIS